MTTVVVPFAGPRGKTRLQLSAWTRQALSLAMLGDVLAACAAVGDTRVATPDPEAAELARVAGAEVVRDSGGGQGAAVQGALDGIEAGPVLVVNADLPCVAAADLVSLLAVTPEHGVALVEARDGTTNALSLPGPDTFAPLYGPGSATRFEALAAGLGLEVVFAAIPNLAEDVDTLDDLHRLRLRCGPRTRACLAGLTAGVER
jgi:2-phospho-L-lactate/phosphoenolpyruvate guanylyltransferase